MVEQETKPHVWSTQETMDGSPALVEIRGSDKLQGAIANAPIEPYIRIKFQAGPLPDGVNGCSIEDVIDVLVGRLEGFQKGDFRCRENALAITKLEEAKLWLLERTRKRQTQGVEGTMQAHKE